MCTDCVVWPGPGSPVLAVKRVCDQRLLAHIVIITFAQSTRAARACVRRCAECQGRCHPKLRILCQFGRRFVHGRPLHRASWAVAPAACRRVASQLAPPPQRTESSTVTLQTPCPGTDCVVWPGPGSPVLAVKRVCDQRLLAHIVIITFAQSTRAARACVRRCAESQGRCHPKLRILCQFGRRFVHGRPLHRASWAVAPAACRRVASQLAPPPQRTESSTVTLQTPCPGPGSSVEHFQTRAQELGGRSLLPACPLPTGFSTTTLA